MSVRCPHCDVWVLIEKINCGIFRHGYNAKTKKQIDPHAPKEICDFLAKDPDIIGCCKPFRVQRKDKELIAIKCDYV